MSGLVLAASIGIYWVWGQAVYYNAEAPDTVFQEFVCRSDNFRQSEIYQAHDCLVIGPPLSSDGRLCHGETMEMAKVDFPERTVRFCVPVRRSDLEKLRVPR